MDCVVCALVSSHIIQNSYFLLLLSKHIRSWLLVRSDIHLFIMSIPDMEATQPPIQLVLEPSCYHNWSLNLTTHFHLVLKLIINRALYPFLHNLTVWCFRPEAINFSWLPLQFNSKDSCRVVFDIYIYIYIYIYIFLWIFDPPYHPLFHSCTINIYHEPQGHLYAVTATVLQ